MQGDTWTRLAADFIGDVERVQVNDIMSVTETAGHLIDGFGTRSRAYVQVQNGCDHRCTFCIIPFGRGNSRSVPAGVVVDQIKRLVGAGYNEVVLTGVDLTSWGARPAAPAHLLDRFDRGGREPDAGHRHRAAPHAASASQPATWR
jgi:threonylcarbamoyladenosine tRNA methylthiotransferase MtaB